MSLIEDAVWAWPGWTFGPSLQLELVKACLRRTFSRYAHILRGSIESSSRPGRPSGELRTLEELLSDASRTSDLELMRLAAFCLVSTLGRTGRFDSVAPVASLLLESLYSTQDVSAEHALMAANAAAELVGASGQEMAEQLRDVELLLSKKGHV